MRLELSSLIANCCDPQKYRPRVKNLSARNMYIHNSPGETKGIRFSSERLFVAFPRGKKLGEGKTNYNLQRRSTPTRKLMVDGW